MEQRKDSGMAGILSFIIPGAGQMYCGEVGTGIGFLFLTVIGYAIFIIPGIIIHICVIVHASNKAKAINASIDENEAAERKEMQAKEIKRVLEIEQKRREAEEQTRQEKEAAAKKVEEEKQRLWPVKENPVAEAKNITAEEFVATIEKLYGLYIKSVFSIHEYGDRKRKEIEKLSTMALTTDEITFLDKLLPLMEKKILLEGDMQEIKTILLGKETMAR